MKNIFSEQIRFNSKTHWAAYLTVCDSMLENLKESLCVESESWLDSALEGWLRFLAWMCSDICKGSSNGGWYWWGCWDSWSGCTVTELIGNVWDWDGLTIWWNPVSWSLSALAANSWLLLWNSVAGIEWIWVWPISSVWWLKWIKI